MEEKKHIVFLDDNAEVTGGCDCTDFVLVTWNSSGTEGADKSDIAVRQSTPNVVTDLEYATRILARAMKSSGSVLFHLVGQSIEAMIDKTIEQFARDAANANRE